MSTPLKVPPLGPSGTRVRTETGIVDCAPAALTTIDCAASPAVEELVAVNVAVPVAPAASVRLDGEMEPAAWYSDVIALHWTTPDVPLPLLPFFRVKKTAVHVPAAGSLTWMLA